MYTTSDIAIAAYLMMRGLKLLNADREKSGKFKFIFNNPDDKASSYAVEFVNSECAQFDSHIKNLKNVLFNK
tara:strand:+ start:9847 stop:10062 length:216 start_codon:yes stop_codon:yes gene_type:complete